MKPSPFFPPSQSPGYSYSPKHQRNPNPFASVPALKHQSPTPGSFSSRSSDQAFQLKLDIARAAAALERKTQVSSPALQPPEPDYRSAIKDAEQMRREEMKLRNMEAVRMQIAEKDRQKALQTQIRQAERARLEAQQRALEEDWAQQRSLRLQQASSYRDALDLQRQVKKVADRKEEVASPLPADLNTLVFDLKEFQSPVYTRKRPRQVATDPLTFYSPQVPRVISQVNVRATGDLASYGRLAMLSPLREPVNDKHAGLGYHDTRGLIQ